MTGSAGGLSSFSRAKSAPEIAAAGFDPSIGLMHGASRNSLPMVYDVMEPLRPVVDEKILIFAQTHTFSPGDFTISVSGGCRLNPQMASKVVVCAAVDARRTVATARQFIA